MLNDKAPNPRFTFWLYIYGMNSKSLGAIESLKAICEECLAGRYEIHVIDAEKEPERLKDSEVYTLPTLVKKLPLPVKRIVGELSDRVQLKIRMEIE